MKSFSALLIAASALVAASGAVASEAVLDERAPPEKMPSAMTPTEIAAYNKGLDPKHRYFIRCRKIDQIGSLAKKARICRTNDEWKESFARGNQNAREAMDAYVSKATVTN